MQSFTEISLSTPISKAIADLGYEKPSPIQAQALPLLLGEPTDFIGLAATGTGKTAAFAIPLLEKIEQGAPGVKALILCPTRELALQVASQINLIGRYKRVKSVAVYGGSSYADQIRGLREGAQVVVGTPGRVVDHIERGTLRLDKLTTIILDEADEMISMGFKEELEKVLAAVPRDSSNIWLFSATMSREVRKVADAYLRSPKQVQVNREEMLSSTVEQYYYPTQEGNKAEVLCKLIEGAEDFYGLVFCQTKALVVDLTQYLSERGYKVDSLHGDKDQTSRERTMQAFRNRRVTILVCTDVASRGLDVKDITHVVNYSLPRELENYVHRIGRTARSGKTGVAMNLVTLSHRRLIYAIENLTKSKMIEGRIPTRREIGARKVTKHLAGFLAQPFHTRAVEVMSEDWKTALAGMTAEEVAGRFLTMTMPDVFNERGEIPSNAKSVAAKVAPSKPSRPAATFDSDAPASKPIPFAAVASEVRPALPIPAAALAEPAIVKPKAKSKAKAIEAQIEVIPEAEFDSELESEIESEMISESEMLEMIMSESEENSESDEITESDEIAASALMSEADLDSELEEMLKDDAVVKKPSVSKASKASPFVAPTKSASGPRPVQSPYAPKRAPSRSRPEPRPDSFDRPQARSRSSEGPTPRFSSDRGPRPVDSHAGPRVAPRSGPRPVDRYSDKPGARMRPRTMSKPGSYSAPRSPSVRSEPRATVGEITRELIKRSKPALGATQDFESPTMNRRARRALQFGMPTEATTGAKSSKMGDSQRRRD